MDIENAKIENVDKNDAKDIFAREDEIQKLSVVLFLFMLLMKFCSSTLLTDIEDVKHLTGAPFNFIPVNLYIMTLQADFLADFLCVVSFSLIVCTCFCDSKHTPFQYRMQGAIAVLRYMMYLLVILLLAIFLIWIAIMYGASLYYSSESHVLIVDEYDYASIY